MIERYTRPEMGKIWAEGRRFHYMLKVEVAVAQAQGRMKIIPRAAASAIAKKGKFQLERILEIEKTTRHDVIAFVTNVAENVGPHGRYVHYGLTSSDVIDTALSLQIQEASKLILQGVDQLQDVLRRLALQHAGTLCAGRTHGMHAEVTSFGLKLAGYVSELRRQKIRLQNAFEQSLVGKLSGAVGTYSTSPVGVEAEVCRRLKLRPETVATQVIPRDRHAEVLSVFALYAGFLERLSVEFRHLQRTEVAEVYEGFTKGQKGSSAMPHKKNPISAENLTGVARLLRSYAQAGFENQALWHERDISHSSVERVVFPDSFILVDYATARLTELLRGLYVDKDRMRSNLELSKGQVFSSYALLALIDAGLSREDAYALVQNMSHRIKGKEDLRSALKRDPQVRELLTNSQIDRIFLEKTLRTKFKGLVQKAVRS